MKTINYIRVSTLEQNPARQENFSGLTLIDKCSGSIAFGDRPNGKKIMHMAKKGEFTTLRVHSIDRLGRNTLDIMNTIQELTVLSICVVSQKEGLSTLTDGKENPISKLIINILATLSEFEYSRIKERQAEGIARAKERGVYLGHGGHRQKESIEEFISKKKNAHCLKFLKIGESLVRSARLAEVSPSTSLKIKRYMDLGKV